MDLNDVLVVRLKRARKKCQPTKTTPEQKMLQNIRYCIKLIRRGDFDMNNMQHLMKYRTAKRMGYIDKDLNILKEA